MELWNSWKSYIILHLSHFTEQLIKKQNAPLFLSFCLFQKWLEGGGGNRLIETESGLSRWGFPPTQQLILFYKLWKVSDQKCDAVKLEQTLNASPQTHTDGAFSVSRTHNWCVYIQVTRLLKESLRDTWPTGFKLGSISLCKDLLFSLLTVAERWVSAE